MRRTQQAPLIAIVDDEAALREATESLLRSAGFSAECYASANEFLQSGCSARASCLILDVRLPGMSGLELQKTLCANGTKLPIIFITAQEDLHGRLHGQALGAGALDFLRKPFDDKHLLDVIRRAVTRRKK
jgi:FixJ family two-component response regulator